MVRPPAAAGSGTAQPAAPPTRPAAPAQPPARPEPARPAAPAAVADQKRAEPAGKPQARPGSRDPNERAERLARALVSDIVAYHPDRRERSLSEGTLRTEFRDEIMKSWDEYVAQVGMSMARSTPYFRDALNTILAKGQELF